MSNAHIDLVYKLINHDKRWSGAPEEMELTLSASEVSDLLNIFEALGLCTREGQDLPRA